MPDLKKLIEDLNLKPIFDKATELGAVDLYDDNGPKRFFEGKATIAFVNEVLFEGETLKEKQARLIKYDLDFMERQKEQDINKIKFNSEEQRQKYIESCDKLEVSCKESLALFEARYKDAESLEEALAKGDISSKTIERPVYDENGKVYERAIDLTVFYCQVGKEAEMAKVIKEQKEEWLKNIDVTSSIKEDVATPNLQIETLTS